MSWMFFLCLFSADPTFTESFTSHEIAARTLTREVQTGTLLFSQGDCLAVKIFTKSPYTHVAAVVKEDGVAWVYDSAKGCGVRKLKLKEYLTYLRNDDLHVFHPAQKFSTQEQRAFQKHLISQLGTEYGIQHHLTGKRADGLHCAEYMTDALMATDLIHANRPSKVSPASLVKGLLQSDLYLAVKTITVEEPSKPEPEGRCARIWFKTKSGSKMCWYKMKGWVFCQ